MKNEHDYIILKELTKRFENSKFQLYPMTTSFKKGEIIGVIGHNGAGKSTFFKLILGLLQPTNGTVTFSDTTFNPKRDIGYLPEQRGLYEKKTILSQLIMLGKMKGRAKEELLPWIQSWLSYFELANEEKTILGKLSKGNQQKIQFICAVLHKPKFLILDEPFSGLDPINTDLFIRAIKKLSEEGTTILYSSHRLDSVQHLANRVIFIKKGSVVHNNSVEEIQKQYPKILHLCNDSITEAFIISLDKPYHKEGHTYFISLSSELEAEEIYNILPNKFSKTFSIEYQSLETIFKEINLSTNDNESRGGVL